ncbi:uncharacterized protein Tco025E_07621 [Trypanosoma conorhini]|uniref:Trans-sialidase n=1 Tax=Trypanosoma conorhini TaxID=83891 RepID=A0A3R7LZD5_9TRYP|nr:uncharacterized protein Tco025E_07621 [Trypanosoma conorhini]RNF06248.1 hypothetical protein Tco025E_07621 [Trypanosoma conorhini]
MSVALCSIASLFFLLCAFPLADGRPEKIQLPFPIASQMSGEWGVEVHSPCDPSVVTGTLALEGETMTMHWQHDAFSGPQLESATSEGETALQVGGLHAFTTRSRGLTALLYTICGERQTNTLHTPHRPGLENKMDTTVLTEYTGVLLKDPADALSTCQTAAPNVFIRLLGSDLRGNLKGSLQFLEMQFDVANLTAHCVETREASGGQHGSAKKDTKGKKGRKRRLGGAKVTRGEHGTVLDQGAVEGSVVLRFVRRTPKSK